MTSSERRRLRAALRDADVRCVLCAGAVDERGHRSLWLPERGEAVPHHVCRDCFVRVTVDQETMNAAATQVALALCSAGGNA